MPVFGEIVTQGLDLRLVSSRSGAGMLRTARKPLSVDGPQSSKIDSSRPEAVVVILNVQICFLETRDSRGHSSGENCNGF